MKKIMLTIMLAFLSTALFAQIDVTFRVNMGAQTFNKGFTPGSDSVLVRGSFQADAGDPGGDWQGSMFKLADGDGDTVYTITVQLPSDSAGKQYEFKFVKNDGGWEGVDNRKFTLTAPSMELPIYWFNNDSVYKSVTIVTNTINFTADLTGIYGSGDGVFDPNQDSILVMGLDWDGLGTVLNPENRKMIEDPFQPGIYKTSLSFSGALGDSTRWKFKAYPDARFSGGGWENGADHGYWYTADGDTVDINRVPAITPVQPALSGDVDVTFTCDVSAGATNRYNGQHVDASDIIFIGMRGGADFLGTWVSGGNWVVADTTDGHMLVLHDDGTNGDATAGDNIWTIKITVPTGTTGGLYEYKYAAYYNGADTANGGSSPLDNEGGFGENHNFILKDGPPINLNNTFGDFTTTGVEKVDNTIPAKYELSQNYPNPFNPSTIINYSIPKEGIVTLKVYNLLGQEVATLLNEQQAAGSYKATFDASQFSSGVYFYTLKSSSVTLTKKMLLLK